jgi:serine/threonine protein kinase
VHAQLSAVESLHSQHYIHRDIKPANFMIRDDGLHPTVFLIDFGLAQLYRNPAMYLHIPYSTDHSIVGTLPFTSINGQQGHSQSRRDDLESLAYTIICSARGDLPWTTISACGDREAVLQKKMSTTAEELCEGLPAPFRNFVNYVSSLDFDGKPDYQYLHSILSQCSAAVTDHPGKALPSPIRSPVNVDCTPVFCDRV